MALNFPWELFLEAQKQKNQNQQNMQQGIAGIGQGLGQIGQGVGDSIQASHAMAARRKLQGMVGSGQPVDPSQAQGLLGQMDPQYQTQSLETQFSPETIAKQKKEQQWQQAVGQLMQDPSTPPQVKQMLPLIAQNPAIAGEILPKLLQQPQKPEYVPVGGQLSNRGRTLILDKFTGKETEGDIPAKATGGSPYAEVRKNQYTMMDLPSNQGPSTAGGAAYQVKVAARQGKSLIAKATNPQAIGLSSADLGRAVQRSAVLAETINASNFANNLTTKWNLLTQKITSDPTSKDIPKIRKEIFDMFDELDKAATPWIENQLADMNDNGFPVAQATRNRQLGLTLPEIKFVGDTGSSQKPATAGSGGWSYVGKVSQ